MGACRAVDPVAKPGGNKRHVDVREVMNGNHMLGDTGDFSNTIYAGFQVSGAGKSLMPFLESDPVLADADSSSQCIIE